VFQGIAYKPKAKVQRNTRSSDESDDEESSNEDAKPASSSVKSKPTKNKQQKSKGNRKKRKLSSKVVDTTDSWRCDKCGNMCGATKKRCWHCQGWRGGIRENIRSPAKTK
jgi:rubrerythrin